MELKSFLAAMSKTELEAFAARVDTTAGHLRNVMYGVRPCATDLAVSIWQASDGRVTRQELRPHDWWRHWPELGGPPSVLPQRSAA
jgi:DNA-binding transcriptional regulator YdaS (Cro superfamily)